MTLCFTPFAPSFPPPAPRPLFRSITRVIFFLVVVTFWFLLLSAPVVCVFVTEFCVRVLSSSEGDSSGTGTPEGDKSGNGTGAGIGDDTPTVVDDDSNNGE